MLTRSRPAGDGAGVRVAVGSGKEFNVGRGVFVGVKGVADGSLNGAAQAMVMSRMKMMIEIFPVMYLLWHAMDVRYSMEDDQSPDYHALVAVFLA